MQLDINASDYKHEIAKMKQVVQNRYPSIVANVRDYCDRNLNTSWQLRLASTRALSSKAAIFYDFVHSFFYCMSPKVSVANVSMEAKGKLSIKSSAYDCRLYRN